MNKDNITRGTHPRQHKRKISIISSIKQIGAVVFWLLAMSFSLIGQNNFSLESVMSSAHPSELAVASANDVAAWVQNKKGVRNIYVSEGAKDARKVTSYEKDDGQGISHIVLHPSGHALFFVRGGAPNRKGEIPNPLSLPQKTKREIWKLDLHVDTLSLVGSGSSPVLSHKGDLLVFIDKGQVWIVNTIKSEEPKLLFAPRGNVGALTWSPDDSKLAFVSRRSDHAFIGVYQLSDQSIRYIDPSVDNDNSPVWSTDSRRVAFIRIPSETRVLPFMAQRSALPWSIRVSDWDGSNAQQIWQADEGSGSAFRFVSATNQLFWTEQDVLVFPWEKEGWTHLYAVHAHPSSQPKLLTPGAGEVKYVSISPDKRMITYSSNQGDIDRHHIWTVHPSEGIAHQVSHGSGIQWSPFYNSSLEKIYLLASGATEPAHPAVIEGGTLKQIPTNQGNEAFPLEHLVVPQQVIFTAPHGMQIHGQLFLPKDMSADKKYPAVIHMHGGSRRQMFLGFHHSGYYHNAYAFNQYLADNGYIVMSINYRSGIGYGMEFREALNFGARGASEFQDVLGAGLYLKSREDVDGERIGLWGGSYGGYLTAMGLAKASELFAAGVDIHGVHDWNIVLNNFVSTYDPLKNPDVAKLAYESSPIAYVENWRSPVLLIHGDDDRNVPFSETVDLVEALRKNDVDFEQLIFPDEVHGFLLHSNWVKAFAASFDFLERKLKGK